MTESLGKANTGESSAETPPPSSPAPTDDEPLPKNTALGVDNLARCSNFTAEELLNELEKRWQAHKIYTLAGRVVVALNPLKALPIYSEEFIVRYQGSNVFSNPPHIFSTADSALSSLAATGDHQTVLISGEIGSGKSQTAKQIVRFLLDSSLIRSRNKNQSVIRGNLLKTARLQEAFGNARLPREFNDDSSRFSRVIELGLNPKTSALQSARVPCFDLDLSSLTSSKSDAFHAYYYFIAGVSDEILARAGIDKSDLSKHRYLGTRRETVPDDIAAYARMQLAFDMLGLKENERERIACIMNAIVRLGDIKFDIVNKESPLPKKLQSKVGSFGVAAIVVPAFFAVSVGQHAVAVGNGLRADESGFTSVANYDVLKCVADLLQIDDVKKLEKSLLCKKILQKTQYLVDLVARELHLQIFNWLVKSCNRVLSSVDSADRSTLSSLLVVDVKEAEVTPINGFEQLCSNLVSEAFQQLFWQRLILYEEDQYRSEGLEWNDFEFDDNEPVLDLFLKTGGFVDVINEGSDDSLLVKSFPAETEHWFPVQNSSTRFGVVHFTGEVIYDSTNWIDQNHNRFPEEIVAALKSSSCSLVKRIAENFGKVGDSWDETELEGKTKLGILRNGLDAFVNRIKLTTPHFVRCIKPNKEMKAGVFDRECVLQQIQQFGIVDAARMSALGYPLRFTHQDFIKRFAVTAFDRTNVPATKENCERILQRCRIEGGAVGESQVLLKDWNGIELETMLRSMYVAAVRIQRAFRRRLQRKEEYRLKREQFEKRLKSVKDKPEAKLQADGCGISKVQSVFLRKVSQTKDKEEAPPLPIRNRSFKAPVKKEPQPKKEIRAPIRAPTEEVNNQDDDDDDDEQCVYVDITEDQKEQLRDAEKNMAVSPPKPALTAAGRDPFSVEDQDVEDIYLDMLGNSGDGDYLELLGSASVAETEDEYLELPGLSSGGSGAQGSGSAAAAAADEDPYTVKRPFIRRVSWAQKPRENWAETKVRKPTRSASSDSQSDQQDWFFGKMTRAEATSLLLAQKPQAECLFIVRSSESGLGYSISTSYNSRTKHFKVDQNPQSSRYQVFGQARSFPTLKLLVDFYHKHPLSSTGETLAKPCLKPKAEKELKRSRPTSQQIVPPQPSGPITGKRGSIQPTSEGRQPVRRYSSSNVTRPPMPLPSGSSPPPPPLPPPRSLAAEASNRVFNEQMNELQTKIRVENDLRAEALSDLKLPTLDKKSKKERQKTLARSTKNLKKLQGKLSALEGKKAKMVSK